MYRGPRGPGPAAEASFVIEQVMLFSLGFLVAALVALAIAPAFWHRAIRLSTRKLEMLLPLSAREVLAERDLLRAEFAVAQRKLEQKVEALGAIHAHDLAELGRRAVALADREAELAILTDRVAALEAVETALERDLVATQDELAATAAALADARTCNETFAADVEHLERHLEVMKKLCANQRVALTALEREVLHERETRILETVRVGRLEDEIAALRIEHEGAVEAAETLTSAPIPPEPKPGSIAADPSLRREIDRLYADLLSFEDVPESGAAASERARRSRRSPAEERAILRKRIGAIGAMAVRLAGSGTDGPAADRKASQQPARIAATESER